MHREREAGNGSRKLGRAQGPGSDRPKGEAVPTCLRPSFRVC